MLLLLLLFGDSGVTAAIRCNTCCHLWRTPDARPPPPPPLALAPILPRATFAASASAPLTMSAALRPPL